MAEETKNEEQQTEPNMVEQARIMAERLEKANTETERLLQKKEQLLAQEKLGGRTSINTAPPAEKPKSYKEQCLDAVKDLEEKKFNPFK